MAHFVARFVHHEWGAYSGKRTGVQFEDEVNENKTENPVEVDKASSEASEEGTHGPSKMFAIEAWLIRTFFCKTCDAMEDWRNSMMMIMTMRIRLTNSLMKLQD